MNVREDLESKLARFEELEQLMSQPEVMSDSGKMASHAREHGSLAKLANKFRTYKKMSSDIDELIVVLSGGGVLAAQSINGLL